MILPRVAACRTAAPLAVLFVVLGMGPPIRAEADHEGTNAHIEVEHGGHWVVLLRHDQKLEVVPLPNFALPVRDVSLPVSSRVGLAEGVSTEDLGFSSRAPPSVRPRAPPLPL